MRARTLRTRSPDGSVVVSYVLGDDEGTIQPPTLPSAADMARSAGKALVSEAKAIASGEPPVSDEIVEARLDICTTCDRYAAESKRCLDCGCYVRFKTRLRSQHCPQGKW